MSFRVSRTSWLMHSDTYRTIDTEYWGLAILPSIPPGDDDKLYELTLHDRIDRLAVTFYGDPRMEWVIKRANGLYLWPIGASPGTVIRIPTKDRLERIGAIKVGLTL